MKAWYEKNFNEDYLFIYQHRDFENAKKEVAHLLKGIPLPKNAKVLDLCCGSGRHAKFLSEAGYQVTGVDLSSVLLDKARSHVDLEFIQADMRKLPFGIDFDAVFNLFTSFGYFENDQENLKVIQEVARVLKPGGYFILDYLNPVYVKDHLVSYNERKEADAQIIEERKIVGDQVCKTIILTFEHDQTTRIYQEAVKLYTYQHFKAFFESAKLKIDCTYGNYNREPYQENTSPRMIITATKV